MLLLKQCWYVWKLLSVDFSRSGRAVPSFPQIALCALALHSNPSPCKSSKTFATFISRNQQDTYFMLKTLISEDPMGRSGQKCAMLTLKFEILGQNQFLVLESWFLPPVYITTSDSPVYPGLQLSHWTPLICMRALKSEDLAAIVDFLYFGEANIF